MPADPSAAPAKRWELYRLLAEPVRLRLLCLTGEDELSVGELAELVGESQPTVSRQLVPLRQAGLVVVRRQGTRTLVRLAAQRGHDPVIDDALDAGRRLCTGDGSLSRVADVVRARDTLAREFFDRAPAGPVVTAPPELGAYLAALAPLVPHRRLAVDVGTGDGGLLEVLAPVFEHVIAVDRSAVRLEQAAARVRARGHAHLELSSADYTDEAFRARVLARGGADAVFASRVLHHAPRPEAALRALGALLAPYGVLVVIDYVAHEDERLRDEQADLWLGFEPDELVGFARKAGLGDVAVRDIPAACCGTGPDGHLGWQVMAARRTSERMEN